MKILSVVGARPNFMKIAPFIRAIYNHNVSISERHQASGVGRQADIDHLLVHTGQHYDDRMSRSFFEELEIPQADINLGIGSGTHAEQVGNTMIEFEKVLKAEKPDWVVVVGDVNAILACSVTAKKEHILCCHIEAGLRSGDLTMPEEINRLVADRISDLLLTPDRISSENLRKEGVPEEKIKMVGNIMIDTLEANREKAAKLEIDEIIRKNRIQVVRDAGCGVQGAGDAPLGDQGCGQAGAGYGVRGAGGEVRGDYAVMTLHRPSNVDTKEILEPIVKFITEEVCMERTVIWTVHPRTRKMLETFGLFDSIFPPSSRGIGTTAGRQVQNLILLEPLSYLEMLRLNMDARVMLTDSGGLQEECTVLGTPCLTLRWNTERPVTLQEHGGASVLVGNNIERMRKEYHNALENPGKPVIPELWDGKTAERCLAAIIGFDKEDVERLKG